MTRCFLRKFVAVFGNQSKGNFMDGKTLIPPAPLCEFETCREPASALATLVDFDMTLLAQRPLCGEHAREVFSFNINRAPSREERLTNAVNAVKARSEKESRNAT